MLVIIRYFLKIVHQMLFQQRIVQRSLCEEQTNTSLVFSLNTCCENYCVKWSRFRSLYQTHVICSIQAAQIYYAILLARIKRVLYRITCSFVEPNNSCNKWRWRYYLKGSGDFLCLEVFYNFVHVKYECMICKKAVC